MPWLEPTAWLLPVYLVALLTDVLDGWVARRSGTTSAAGAVLDEVNPTGLGSQFASDVVQVDSIGISETNDGVEGAARSRR